jgi:hypothetical protein
MNIPKRFYQRWEGETKLRTKDCDGCDFYRKIDGKELCGWGVAFKYLERTGKPRKCEVRNRPARENQSIKYLDEFIKNAMD